MSDVPLPNVEDGITYWNTQPASYDGVLGGFGNGTLPRVDAMGSRMFLLHLRPDLSTVPSSLSPLSPPVSPQRIRALDVGAGVGRVTSDVLLHLASDVVLLEPVDSFVQEAFKRGSATDTLWTGVKEKEKSVTFMQGTLQTFNPSNPVKSTKAIGHVGREVTAAEGSTTFDIQWCQWCLGHLSDIDLVAFFKRAKLAMRDSKSLIVVKENLCTDDDGGPRTVFDAEDSSLTRSGLAWKKIFMDAGLRIVREKVQEGLPEGLYVVKMYALK